LKGVWFYCAKNRWIEKSSMAFAEYSKTCKDFERVKSK
jgi:hypothetical protein